MRERVFFIEETENFGETFQDYVLLEFTMSGYLEVPVFGDMDAFKGDCAA